MKRFASLASASVVAILAACSSSTTGTASSDACAKYFDSLVQTGTRCGITGSSVDPANKTNFVAYCQATVTAPGSGVTDSYLSTCGNALASATSCNISQVPGCENPAGKLANSAPCLTGAQCQSGACDGSGSAPTDGGVADAGTSTGPSCGTCQPRAAENAACGGTNPQCMSGLTCNSGTCVKSVSIPSGGACSYSGPPGTNCATGTTCIPGSGGTTTCEALPKKGEQCTYICDTGLTCSKGTCQEKVAVGGACPTGNECQSTLYCDQATKLCAALKVGKAGDACGSSAGVKCDAGLSCKSSVVDGPTTCIALKNKGETCVASSDECAAYLDCISGTCQTPDPSQCK